MTFHADIVKFVNKTNLRAETIIRKLALDMLAGCLARSPVDTGRFRGSWRLSLEGPDLSVEGARTKLATDVDIGDAPTGAEMAAALTKLRPWKLGVTIYITNNLPYALRLENESWSMQAPGVGSIMRASFDQVKAEFAAEVGRAA